MKVKTNELSGLALDWAVSRCEGYEFDVDDGVVLTGRTVVITDGDFAGCGTDETYTPSTDWSEGGPIIERERIDVRWAFDNREDWTAWPINDMTDELWQRGPTPLIAAMRCYVDSVMGDTVEVPDELVAGEPS